MLLPYQKLTPEQLFGVAMSDCLGLVLMMRERVDDWSFDELLEGLLVQYAVYQKDSLRLAQQAMVDATDALGEALMMLQQGGCIEAAFTAPAGQPHHWRYRLSPLGCRIADQITVQQVGDKWQASVIGKGGKCYRAVYSTPIGEGSLR